MRFFSAIILSLMVWLCGCSSTPKVPSPEYSYNPKVERQKQAGKRALVLPTLVTASMGTDWDALCQRVDREIITYLEAQGYEATYIELEHLSGRKIDAEGFTRNPYCIPDALQAELSSVDTQSETDLVVLPNLQFKPTVLEYPYRESAWNGVLREVDAGSEKGGRWLSNMQISLNVRVTDSQGTGILSGYGGLDLAQKTVFEKRGKGGVRHLIPIRSEDVDDAYITESVQLAFHPMIPVADFD